jgi:hypothetical protein
MVQSLALAFKTCHGGKRAIAKQRGLLATERAALGGQGYGAGNLAIHKYQKFEKNINAKSWKNRPGKHGLSPRVYTKDRFTNAMIHGQRRKALDSNADGLGLITTETHFP